LSFQQRQNPLTECPVRAPKRTPSMRDGPARRFSPRCTLHAPPCCGLWCFCTGYWFAFAELAYSLIWFFFHPILGAWGLPDPLFLPIVFPPPRKLPSPFLPPLSCYPSVFLFGWEDLKWKFFVAPLSSLSKGHFPTLEFGFFPWGP